MEEELVSVLKTPLFNAGVTTWSKLKVNAPLDLSPCDEGYDERREKSLEG